MSIFNLTTFANLSHWTPPTTPPANTTNKITFSNDTNLILIETDHYNPIQIMNLSTFQIIQTIPVNDVIKDAYFFDVENTMVVVFGQNSFVVANLTSNKQ